MNLKDFYLLSKIFSDLLAENDPTPYYESLINNVDAARQSPTTELQTAIKEDVTKIIEANSLFEQEVNKLPHGPTFLESFSIANYVGDKASEELKNILQNESFSSTESLRAFTSGIAQTKNRLTTITNTLNEMGFELEEDEEETDRIILSIQYTGKASINDTDQLKKRLDDIKSIMHAFARLSNDKTAFETPKIQGISKSSPLVIDISHGTGAVVGIVSMAKAVQWAMDRIQQQYDIRIKRQELIRDKMSNSSIERGFQALEQKQTSDSQVKQFVTKLIQECNPVDNGDDNGAPNEVKKALVESVRTIISMVDDGANVGVFIPPAKEGESAPVDGEPEKVAVSLAVSGKSLMLKQTQLQLLIEETSSMTDDQGVEGDGEPEEAE